MEEEIKQEIKRYNKENRKGNGGFYFEVFCENIKNICCKYMKDYDRFIPYFSCVGYIYKVLVESSTKGFTIKL